jgi:glycosyltransferase involved in cell wall biosynthesis
LPLLVKRCSELGYLHDDPGTAMRIGLIAPPWVPVPPPTYGGTEIVIDNLARGLQSLGHDVQLFTVGESTCPVTKQFRFSHAIPAMGAGLPEAAHVLAAYDALDHQVDIIHDHTTLGPLLAGRHPDRHPPIVTTNHGPFTHDASLLFAEVAPDVAIVAISHNQAASAGTVPIAAVIHHGVDLELYQPGRGQGGYLLFMGRMTPEKGAHRALRAAKRAGHRLVIVAKMREPEERAYYQQCVAPLLGPGDSRPRELPVQRRRELLQGAKALLNPIAWPEPFGLVMIEALAAGTPVLAFPNGSAPEIVDDGVTGFLCADEDDLTAAIGRLDTIDRSACRRAAEQRFSLDRMVRAHEGLYRRVLLGAQPVARLKDAMHKRVQHSANVGDPLPAELSAGRLGR